MPEPLKELIKREHHTNGRGGYYSEVAEKVEEAVLVENHIIRETKNNTKLSNEELKLLLVQAALEARDKESDGIELAPHFCLHGQLLFPVQYASITIRKELVKWPLDTVLKVDDAAEAFFNNDNLVLAVKFTYHNNWAAKTHGDRQDNKATMAFVTTNLTEPIQRLSKLQDADPMRRRFVEAVWTEESRAPYTGQYKKNHRKSNQRPCHGTSTRGSRFSENGTRTSGNTDIDRRHQ